MQLAQFGLRARDQANGEFQKIAERDWVGKDGFAKLLYGLAGETREQHEASEMPTGTGGRRPEHFWLCGECSLRTMCRMQRG